MEDETIQDRNIIKRFLLDNRDIERNGYIWNMIGSLLNAFQSVFLLIIINRVIGESQSGIFTIAFANANLFLNMGKYGMRYYQVSDVKHEHSFGDYFTSRVISSSAMIISALAYTIYATWSNNYSSYKMWIIIVMCIFKTLDCFEDVYGAQYQNHERLDIAGRIMAIRMSMLILVFGGGVIIFKNMLTALIVTMVTNTIVWLYLTVISYKTIKITFGKINFKNIRILLIKCFPLFAGAFLSFYIGNAPKYAIDSQLSDELQASYGFIAMPVFVVGMLSHFIFNPQIVGLTRLWEEGKTGKFVGRVAKQAIIIIGITMICIGGAFLLGIPVLSSLYRTDLKPYKSELLILLLGGGFLGLTGLLNTSITIIRFQKTVIWGYLTVAVLALVFSNRVVEKYGITGASVFYTALMAMLSLIFVILFLIGVRLGRKDKSY